MKKNLYSLLLMEDVVSAIDNLAYQQGTSRSNLINQILAEYCSLMTPQKRIEQIFESLSEVTERDSTLQVQNTSSTMLNLRSVINYKYNPTIRYSVTFALDEDEGYSCEFKAVSRTQSDVLIEYLSGFYQLWIKIEKNCLAGKLDGNLRYQLDGANFYRMLSVVDDGQIYNSNLAGEAIGNYIMLFDRAMKIYFDKDNVEQQINKLYNDMLQTAEIII